MAEPIKPDGRETRSLNQAAIDQLAIAKQHFFAVMGSTDPVAYQKALREIMKAVEAAHVNLYEVDKIHALAAMRGSYKKSESE